MMTEAANSAAQAPPAGSAPPPPPPTAPAAPPPTAAPPATAAPPPPAAWPAPAAAAPAAAPAATPAPSATSAPAPAPAAGTGAATEAPAAPAAPAPPATTSILDKVSADAFVDAYYSFNSNAPKPAAFSYLYGQPGAFGGNPYRAFDVAQGFALNWIGVNASYAADPIGATIGLRLGPAATIYSAGTPDATSGLQFVKQAYATWKPADKFTLDFGKWDQPYGSEVADSQLNMNYSRSMLFWYAQPLWFTGLRADYAAADAFDLKLLMANGWNETLKLNRSYTFGAQVMIKPADAAVFYLGYVGGPQQQDWAISSTGTGASATTGVVNVPDANDHWRHLVDVVADINPTKQLRFLLNGDYRTEAITSSLNDTFFGANLVIRYQVSDPFGIAIRGEYVHEDPPTATGVTPPSVLGTGQKTDFEDGTLTLLYTFGSHLTFMIDARYDTASTPNAPSGFSGIFQKNANESTNGQFTATLGVIASTK
jgi:hypothetical protein